MLNEISHHPDFLRSSLERMLEENPLGFIDVGSTGGVHPLILPLASRSQCRCFEPDPVSFRQLNEMYEISSPFSRLVIHDTAIGGGPSEARLYVTKSPVNTSILEPDEGFSSRYGVEGLRVDKVSSINIDSLDHVLAAEGKAHPYAGEFIKLDCQGAEFDTLTGARETLDKDCVAVLCEVEFLRIYRNQKLFSDIDVFLRSRGFSLYGLHPHFISGRRLNRVECETEERLVWADALYLKDPLEFGSERRPSLNRQVRILFLVAVLTHYYDYALELLEAFDWSERDRQSLKNMVVSCARSRREALERDADRLMGDLRAITSAGGKYVTVKKFVDAHRSNSNIDFVVIDGAT